MADSRPLAHAWSAFRALSLRRQAAWLVRGAFVLAVIAGLFWLFALYRPDPPQTYPQRQKVTYWHTWSGDPGKIVGRIVERFNQSQDTYEVVPLTIASATGSLKTLIATAGGDPPDCMTQWDNVIPAWAERNALTPLDSLMDPAEWAELRDSMYPAVRAIGTYKGHFYGLSVGMNVTAIYYRPSHFVESGLDPNAFPTRLEELDRLSDKLWRYDANGRVTRVGFMPTNLPDWAAVFGGSFYDAEEDRITMAAPRNVAALEWMASYARGYDFERVQAFMSGLPSFRGADWPFIRGAYSITVDGQWRVEELSRFAPELDYQTAPLPYPEGGKPLAGWSNGNFMLIPAGAKNKKGAWEFIKFWAGVDDPDRAAEFYTWGGWLPITPRVAEAPAYQQFLQRFPKFRTFLTILESPNLQVTPPVPVQAYLSNRLRWAEDAARRGVLAPQAALEKVQAEVLHEMKLMGFSTGRPADEGDGP